MRMRQRRHKAAGLLETLGLTRYAVTVRTIADLEA